MTIVAAPDTAPPATPLDEQQLVERARDGDADAFARLYRLHLDAVWALAWRRTGERHAAEDVTAASFERALRGLRTFRWRGGGSFRSWLLGICAHEAAELHRQRQRHTTPKAQALARRLHDPSGDDDPDGLVERDAAGTDAVRAALAAINPRYERALLLRHVTGLTNEEAAAAMGVARPTMAVLLHRATAAFRTALDRIESAGGTHDQP